MEAGATLADALLAAGTVALFVCGLFYSLYRIVVWTRRRLKRSFVIGAIFSPFIMLGNVSDPDFRTVQEAKRLKNREDDDSGDPPDLDEHELPLDTPPVKRTPVGEP